MFTFRGNSSTVEVNSAEVAFEDKLYSRPQLHYDTEHRIVVRDLSDYDEGEYYCSITINGKVYNSDNSAPATRTLIVIGKLQWQ